MIQDEDFFFEAKPSYVSVGSLFQTHRGWAMLRSRNHALLIPFFHKMFIERNLYSIEESDLASAWAQEISSLQSGSFGIVDKEDGIDLESYDARATIRSWSSPTCGYLRAKDEFIEGATVRIYDVDPTVIQALRFIEDLHRHQTVGAETRIQDVFRKLSEVYSELNPDAGEQIRVLDKQIEELELRRQRILLNGAEETDPRRAKEKVLSFKDTAMWMSRDFEQLRVNFKQLALKAQKLLMSEHRFSDSLTTILDVEDALYESDQGKSFTGYLRVVNNPALRDQFEQQMSFILEHPEVRSLLGTSLRELRRMPDRWNKELIRTQESVAHLSGHIKKFVVNHKAGAYLALMGLVEETLKNYANTAGADDEDLDGIGIEVLQTKTELSTPMSRTLFSQRVESPIPETEIVAGDESSVSAANLQRVGGLDEDRVAQDIQAYFEKTGVSSATASEIIGHNGIEHGAEEVITYLKTMSQKTEGLLVSKEERESVDILHMDPTGQEKSLRISFDQHRILASSWKKETAVGLEERKNLAQMEKSDDGYN